MNQAKDLVEKALREYEMCRNSDMSLLITVWADQGLKLSSEQVNFLMTQAVSAESITRARRKFQESGKYLPTPKVEVQRSLLAEEAREHYPRTMY